MYMKKINSLLLLFLCLLVTGQAWADIKVVIDSSTDKNTEGSLPYFLANISEGDTIEFDETLKSTVIDFGSGSVMANKKISYTIIGNGVVLKGGKFTFINGVNIKIEGLKFQSSQITVTTTPQIQFTNCTFNSSFSGDAIICKTTAPNGTIMDFAGCCFISEKTLSKLLLMPSKTLSVYFSSCSFYNAAPKNPGFFLFDSGGKMTLTATVTNCVIVDSNDQISNFPITSGGYNVVKGGLFDGSTFTTEQKDIFGSDIEDPLIIINSIPEVREAGGAYQHFPVLEGLSFPEGVNFPEKDIEGTFIDYTKITHSGACQESTDITIVPVTGLSLNKAITTFTLSRKEIHDTLTVKPTPSNATFEPSQISWESNNTSIATVENGVVTAVAPGKTTITATYDNDESMIATCEVTVFEYITVTSAAESGEGSLNAILPTLQDGDVISFSDELKDTPITLGSPSDKKNQINKSIKILGNGVTLTGQCLTVVSEGVVMIENLNFKDLGINARNNTDTLYIRNCTFEENTTINTNNLETAIYAPASKTLVVEGSSFVSNTTATAIFAEWSKGYNGRIHLTSCSFVNTKNASTSRSAGNIIYTRYSDGMEGSSLQRPPEIILTNCVIQDNPPRSAGSITPAIAVPVIRSKGYNVIKGLIATELTSNMNDDNIFDNIINELSVEKEDKVSASMQNPIIKDDGVYKVVEGRLAHNHLPANTTIAGVSFPVKDLTGTDITYGQSTHSGAIQATIEPTEAITGINLFALSSTLDKGKTAEMEVVVTPENAKSETVTWASSDAAAATVENGLVSARAEGKVTITAQYGDKTATFDLAINGTSLESLAFEKEKDTLFIAYPRQLTVNVLPANAAYLPIEWSSSDSETAAVDSKGYITPLTEGVVTITATDQESHISTSCEITIKQPDYTNGVFLVNEDWYMHFNGTVNYLTPEGKWLYRAVQQENPGRELGATTQFGAIYNDKFYLVSKQDIDQGAIITGSRFAVCDAKTMKIEKEFQQIEFGGNKGDGRSFLGVDENTGYVSTSNGIYIFDLKEQKFTGRVVGSEGGGQGTGDPESDPNLYNGQVGTMLRIGDRVFANHQSKGLLIINPVTNKVDTVLAKYHFTAIVQAKDGYLWAGTTQDISGGSSGNRAEKQLLKIDPWTLDITEIPLTIEGPYANWGAWRADAFCASDKENKLYWRNMPTFYGTKIYEYDIASNTLKTVFELSKYDDGHWRIYETGFRMDPVTNNLYISVNGGDPINLGGRYNRTLKLDLATGDVATYELEEYYWFPAMYVFPDNKEPDVSKLEDKITMTGKRFVVTLNDKVTDADNMDVSIIKSLLSNSNEELIEASIVRDELHITLLKSVGEETESSTLKLRFNSNGKVIEKVITVNATNISLVPAASITLSQSSNSLTVGETLQLTATVLPDNASDKKVSWESSDESIASVTSEGLVKALKAGTAKITAKSVYDDDLKAECVITVSNPVIVPPEVPFLISEQSLTLYTNQMAQLTTNAEAGQLVSWSSSKSSIATVNNGQVVAIGSGATTITATNTTTGKSASCEVTVREIEILPDVDVEETAAYIIFPRLEGADYYLVSVYQLANGQQTLAFTLNVNADGSLLRSSRAGAGDINIYLPNLQTATKYVAVIEAMRKTSSGKDEVLKVLSTPNFTTGSSTSNELTVGQKPEVYYSTEALLLKGMEGYTCYLVTLNGQVKDVFEVHTAEEIHRVDLSAGVYLLTGTNGTNKVTFKFMAK